MIFQGNIKQRSVSGADLKSKLNELFNAHVYWTRMFVVSNLADLPDSKEVAERLIKNQKDIGLYLGIFYPSIAQSITSLFTEHIIIASDIVESIKRRQDISVLRKKWYENADKIHTTLFQVNQNLNLRPHLYKHLQLTENGLSHRFNKNYSQEIENFDHIVNQANEMSDYIAKSVIFNNPTMFK